MAVFVDFWCQFSDLNVGIRIANSAAVGGVQAGDILGSSHDLTDTAQFVLGLLFGDPVVKLEVRKEFLPL